MFHLCRVVDKKTPEIATRVGGHCFIRSLGCHKIESNLSRHVF